MKKNKITSPYKNIRLSCAFDMLKIREQRKNITLLEVFLVSSSVQKMIFNLIHVAPIIKEKRCILDNLDLIWSFSEKLENDDLKPDEKIEIQRQIDAIRKDLSTYAIYQEFVMNRDLQRKMQYPDWEIYEKYLEGSIATPKKSDEEFAGQCGETA